MAHLLGSKFCIESLRNDVTDLQGVVVDVFSRVGPVRLPSWKYPDKISCDLDLTDLLEVYDYSEDEEERQVSHIILMELVIDRMVLLIQAMAKYADQVLHSGRGGPSPQNTSNTSIGLVVKKYWNKMVQLGTQTHQTQTENKNKSRTIHDLEGTMTKMLDKSSSVGGIPHVTIPLNDADASRLLGGAVTSASNLSISRDECIKATQTIETAFVPCESCHMVQKHFREVGENVINICSTQDLPSSLVKHKTQVEKLDWLCGSDVSRWATEQNKDLSRVNKHLSQLHSTIEPLKTNLNKEQHANKQMHSRVSECEKEVLLERETQAVQRKQYEIKLTDVQQKSKNDVTKVQRQNTELLRGKTQLEQQLETMKTELGKQQDMIQELERAKQQIVQDMEEKMTNNEHVHHLEEEIETKHNQLERVQDEMCSITKELSREKAKSKSVNRHTESLQGKQESLVHRLDELDQENEELRNTVSELDEEKDQLVEKIGKLDDEKRDMRIQLKDEQHLVKKLTCEKENLVKTTTALEEEIHQQEAMLEESREKERLIVEYPDINGPVNPDLTGTGDIGKDMENQVKANCVRISVLEEQNTRLRNSITKLLQSHSGARGPMTTSKPLPLWKMEESAVREENHSNYSHEENMYSDDPPSATQYWESSKDSHVKTAPSRKPPLVTGGEHSTRESFVVGQGQKSSRNRPQSGKATLTKSSKATESRGGSSSISTYKQLKKAGLLQSVPSQPPYGKPAPPSETSDYQPSDVVACPKCDKMYNSARDLDLHRLYCGGV